jgi:hypothetical protein
MPRIKRDKPPPSLAPLFGLAVTKRGFSASTNARRSEESRIVTTLLNREKRGCKIDWAQALDDSIDNAWPYLFAVAEKRCENEGRRRAALKRLSNIRLELVKADSVFRQMSSVVAAP